MNTLLFLIVALTVSTPIAAAVLVSIASRREDRDLTLENPSVGSVRMIARRIVGFHTDSHKRRSLRRVPVGQLATSRSRRRPAEQGSRLRIASR